MVTAVRNVSEQKTVWNTTEHGASEAKASWLVWPTTDVSTTRMSGSTSTEPSAGMARAQTSEGAVLVSVSAVVVCLGGPMGFQLVMAGRASAGAAGGAAGVVAVGS